MAIINKTSTGAIIDRHVFTYNGFDVIVSKTITTGTPLDSFTTEVATYNYNNLNQLLSSTNPNQSFTYDDDGNMTQGYTPEGYPMTMTYDAENRLTSVQYTDSSSVVHRTEYSYSGDNLLVEMKKYEDGALANDTRYVRAGFLPIQERDGNNAGTREYTWGLNLGGGIGGLLNLNQGNTDYSYLYDGRGNVMALLKNSDQSIAASYRYDEFGKLLKKVGALSQPFMFSTKQYDEQNGLSHHGFRFYNPAIGKWTTRDPIGERGDINLYRAMGNNPVNWIDPEGLHLWPPPTNPGSRYYHSSAVDGHYHPNGDSTERPVSEIDDHPFPIEYCYWIEEKLCESGCIPTIGDQCCQPICWFWKHLMCEGW